MTLSLDTTFFRAHPTEDTSAGLEAMSTLDRALLFRDRGRGELQENIIIMIFTQRFQ